MDPLELAKQRAEAESVQGSEIDTTDSIKSRINRRPSDTDWGTIRGPNDPIGDGGRSTISLPGHWNDRGNRDDDFDNGGFGSFPHPNNNPYKHLLDKPVGELTDEERTLLLDQLSSRARSRQQEHNEIEIEKKRFRLAKDRSVFSLIKTVAIGFVIFAATAFGILIALLVYISIKHQSFNDTSVIGSILSTFASFFQILAGM